MGVYIKDMEMPKCCAECKMYVEDIYCCHLLHREIENPWADDGVELDCPLVLVPPHGRLIDADEIKKRISHMNMEAYMDGACYGIHPSLEYLDLLNEILDDAPTIIPAEEKQL